MDKKTAILDLRGGRCASCVYAIEHLGRKVQGVSEVRVDAGSGEIRVRYEGDPDCLQGIVDVVARLGYEARVRADGVHAGGETAPGAGG